MRSSVKIAMNEICVVLKTIMHVMPELPQLGKHPMTVLPESLSDRK